MTQSERVKNFLLLSDDGLTYLQVAKALSIGEKQAQNILIRFSDRNLTVKTNERPARHIWFEHGAKV